MLGVRRHLTGSPHGGTAHREECRDRVQNKMATAPGEADRYEKAETRRLDRKRPRFETDKLPQNAVTVNVETMDTVQIGGSSSVGAAQSSSACAAQPSDQLPSRRAVETAREAPIQQTGGDEMIDDQPSRKRPAESQGGPPTGGR